MFSKKHKVITFGEILGRLSPPNHLRFSQASSLEVIYGGGEFNVAASLANYGIRAQFISAVPDNAIGDCVLQSIRSRNVGAKYILRQGNRLGLYFLEHGASGRNSAVVYDRANSAMSEVKPGQFDWDMIFKGATWFHWSGITPALSQSAADTCLEAVKAAAERGLTISTDLNYRSKLWKYGKQPKEIMPELLKYSNVILADVDTAMFMLGKAKINPDYSKDDEVKMLFDKIIELLPNVHTIGMTFRNSVNASHQRIGGLLYKDNQLYRARINEISPVVDRVGTGDAFMGGLLYGLIEYKDDLQKAVAFATSACVIKHTIFGDVNRASKQEVVDFMESDGSALVDR
ncbi:2-dehydro-3-deoxygluconokinase [Wenyingzhuangia fucanilytica]|uniref:2-dehydro-3-deoxygluconokinase n=1 Tax=Wenyingzhuangia fucanilytica TaxID=1790137 RepID=A0A1B1Y850_9FLAO|nr:sugar kinase [Wenyingzhuangia fucanilytica]ANW96936.1 2-dehydro-3-deoxygluconokinase [Wenyingzhuangia fucanilytica]